MGYLLLCLTQKLWNWRGFSASKYDWFIDFIWRTFPYGNDIYAYAQAFNSLVIGKELSLHLWKNMTRLLCLLMQLKPVLKKDEHRWLRKNLSFFLSIFSIHYYWWLRELSCWFKTDWKKNYMRWDLTYAWLDSTSKNLENSGNSEKL